MQELSPAQTDAYLQSLAMEIGPWGEFLGWNDEANLYAYLQKRSPSDAQSLYVFALAVTSWIFSCDWLLFKFDHSTALSPDQALILTKHLHQPGQTDASASLIEKCFLFGEQQHNAQEFIQLAILVHYVLLFEQHANIVSGGGKATRKLSVQDGFAYFKGSAADLHAAEILLSELTQAPLQLPPAVMANLMG